MTMQALLTLGKAFSEPVRVRIIALLKHGELCVCELCDVLDLRQSTLSTHLQFLRQSGLVNTRQDGKWVYYTLAKPMMAATRAMFRLQERELAEDAVLRADVRNLKARLAKRGSDGACCVGFVKPTPAGGKRPVKRRACCA